MLTCYCCGKLLLGKKVLGQVGPAVYQFCSEKCRNKTWQSLGTENPDMERGGFNESLSGASSSVTGRKIVVKSGEPSRLKVSGAEYEFNAKTEKVVMSVGEIANKSDGITGTLRLELFLSKNGPYSPGARLSGITVAESSTYEPLKKNYSYTKVTSTVIRKAVPKAGSYNAILFVRELNEDGQWHIAGWANFSGALKW